MISDDQQHNYDIFRDCFSVVLIERITRQEEAAAAASGGGGTHNNRRTRRRQRKAAEPGGAKSAVATDAEGGATTGGSNSNSSGSGSLGSPEELADFVEFTTEQTFEYLPEELKTVQHYDWAKDDEMQSRYQLPLTSADVADLMPSMDPAIEESLSAYGIVEGAEDEDDDNKNNNKTKTSAKAKRNPQGILQVLAPVLSAFITTIATPPPPPVSTKQAAQEAGCEICGRDWVNLTYHHLIPRFVHDKVVKRGWHREEDLQNVAWLCAACHRFVHRFAGHEELARHYYTVDLLMQEESIVKWADWVGRLRWKGR